MPLIINDIKSISYANIISKKPGREHLYNDNFVVIQNFLIIISLSYATNLTYLLFILIGNMQKCMWLQGIFKT